MNHWEDDSRLEAELSCALDRVDAPDGFADSVMAAVRADDGNSAAEVIEFSRRPKLRIWAAVAAAAASLAIGFGIHHRIQTNELAALAEAQADEARLVESLKLAGITLNRAHSAAFGAEDFDGE